MEAWRRALDEPARAFPIEKAGPVHIATLKTFEPPLSALDGKRLAGAERRGKRLLFPTEDGELVLLVHLMTADGFVTSPPARKGRSHRPSGFASKAAPSSCSPRPARRNARASGC